MMAATTHKQRLHEALDQLAVGLRPFVDGEMQARSPKGADWVRAFQASSRNPQHAVSLDDPQFLLRVMIDCWRSGFEQVLGREERNLVSEVLDLRNRVAHNSKPFNFDDTYRGLDSVERLLLAVGAPDSAEAVNHSRLELMRQRHDDERRKAAERAVDVGLGTTTTLPAWRDVITPHHDVATDAFQQAEFAADLARVHRGEGEPEYRDPREFFRRTYLTNGLGSILRQAFDQLTGSGTTPVVDLQTSFGGGKTHSMLALYHLFGGIDAQQLPEEVRTLLDAGGHDRQLPKAKRIVLVGTGNLAPTGQHHKADDLHVNTIWGELAYQLGGREGYARLEQHDRQRVSPSSEELGALLDAYGPALVLIDEWVAYARQLYNREDLPAGSLDAQQTFAQALTEAAAASDNTMVVVSIPASTDGKQDGDGDWGSEAGLSSIGGQTALQKLRAVVGRTESSWRPADAEEAFEIVRRRLFEPLTDVAMLNQRDLVVDRFADFYRRNAADFPIHCRDLPYVERMRRAYPIHPELFDRLYGDWSSLPRFQRTRGVLRLMAAVIHGLWTSDDRSPMILPASMPLQDTKTEFELTRHLNSGWKPVIDTDIDGVNSTPQRIDRQYPAQQRYSATRRVARAIFMGSAPTLDAAQRGVEAPTINLGSIFPDENVAAFGDALRKLGDQASHLYQGGSRWWFSTDRSVVTVARELREQFLTRERDHVEQEIVDRLRREARQRGDFGAVHACPDSTGDVPDEAEARLIILPPDRPHSRSADDSAARMAAAEYLERRGNSARQYRNMVLFLAPEQRELDNLFAGVAEHLAWEQVVKDIDTGAMTVDGHQERDARDRAKRSDGEADLRLSAAYQWVLWPSQPDPTGPIVWEEARSEAQQPLAVRASKRLAADDQLLTRFGAEPVRMQLDGPISAAWADGHISVKDLWDLFARYPYLPRLASLNVLIAAVEDGPGRIDWERCFATADAWDDAAGRYVGLCRGSAPAAVVAGTLLVHPERTIEEPGDAPVGSVPADPIDELRRKAGGHSTQPARPERLQRFYGTVSLDATRPTPAFAKVVEEVVSLMAGQLSAKVSITVDISADDPDGFPDDIVRAVRENARTLRFDQASFEA